MDYRDNRQRWAESHQVVHFYAGQWCTFTPALTLGNAAEKNKGSVVPVQPGLRRRRRVGRNEAGIAVGKCHDDKMRPILDAGDDRIRLAKVRLSMARRM